MSLGGASKPPPPPYREPLPGSAFAVVTSAARPSVITQAPRKEIGSNQENRSRFGAASALGVSKGKLQYQSTSWLLGISNCNFISKLIRKFLLLLLFSLRFRINFHDRSRHRWTFPTFTRRRLYASIRETVTTNRWARVDRNIQIESKIAISIANCPNQIASIDLTISDNYTDNWRKARPTQANHQCGNVGWRSFCKGIGRNMEKTPGSGAHSSITVVGVFDRN